MASEPVNPRSNRTSSPRGVEMAMRRFVCVYAMVNPPLRSIHPCEHRIACVRLELFGFEPPYPPKPGSVEPLVAQPAIRNLRGSQKNLNIEGQCLPYEETRKLDESGYRAASGQEIDEAVQTHRPHANTEAGLLIPNLLADKCAHAQLVSLQLGRQVAAVRILQIIPTSQALVYLHGNGEIIPQDAAHRGGRVRTLRNQTRVPQQALVVQAHAPAQAKRTHAD